jgi:hypothetical protein
MRADPSATFIRVIPGRARRKDDPVNNPSPDRHLW